ncbi:hypothetical protein [Salinigranum marinum]|uniref:hypothetical protein n=1 Tax=Salinigranum marinum TaxID=1515595 RepID=UPI002989F628|nr:hypothetical protein [Salinigranum marinum]
MRRLVTTGVVGSTYNAVVRPSRFVRADVARASGSLGATVSGSRRLLTVFVVNLVIYAVPITLAGFGSTFTATAPPSAIAAVTRVGGLSPIEAWDFAQRFVQNSLYISLGAALTFLAFHGSVWLTRSSAGVLPSLHTVVYSTSAYLAGVFSVVWFIATAPSVVVVDQFVLNVQKRFIYTLIDATGAGLELPSGRPTAVDLAGATPTGQLALATLVVTVGYFVYSMYLGSRLNHGASQTTAAITVVTVGATPAAFVLGSIALTLTGGSLV